MGLTNSAAGASDKWSDARGSEELLPHIRASAGFDVIENLR